MPGSVGPLARLVRRIGAGSAMSSVIASHVIASSILACSAGTGAGGSKGCPASPGAPLSEACPDVRQPDAEAPARSVEVGGVVQGGRASMFELGSRAGEPARVLRITVREVDNPRGQNLVLVIAALLPARSLELGRLSFFPASQAGTFVLPLPATVAEHVAREGALTLRCTLEADAAAGLDGVRVRLRTLTLGAEP